VIKGNSAYMENEIKKYYIWSMGCQMNTADTRRVASKLEALGYLPAQHEHEADLIVLNTCVVRQSAEDKASGHINSLKPLKKKNPQLVINVMGCLVGYKEPQALKERFPFVDVFSPPSDINPLLAYLLNGDYQSLQGQWTEDGEYRLPLQQAGQVVTAQVPIVYGCSHACTFCIIPYRRGAERSRPAQEILTEVQALADQGVKEITLLGQIVDRYGKDLKDGINLASLLRQIHTVAGIERIRFLTSHPNWMTAELIHTVAELPKVMPHFEVPIQSGDDEVLKRMRRAYTVTDYRRLIHQIRAIIPEAAIANDIIVGFPGETEKQFENTRSLVEELRLDVIHLACYSARPGTIAARHFTDDVPLAEKQRRFKIIEALHERIASEINQTYLGTQQFILFEAKVKGRWMGRTPTNKIVFVQSDNNLLGKILPVTITKTSAWSMQGRLETEPNG